AVVAGPARANRVEPSEGGEPEHRPTEFLCLEEVLVQPLLRRKELLLEVERQKLAMPVGQRAAIVEVDELNELLRGHHRPRLQLGSTLHLWRPLLPPRWEEQAELRRVTLLAC